MSNEYHTSQWNVPSFILQADWQFLQIRERNLSDSYGSQQCSTAQQSDRTQSITKFQEYSVCLETRFQTISCKILLFLFLLCQSFSIPRTWLIQPPYPTKMAAVCSQKKSQKNLQFANNIIIKNCHLIKLAPLIFTSSELTKEVLGRMLSQTVKRQREITTKPLCEFGIKAENKSATTEASVSSIFPLLPKLCGIPEFSSQ